MKKEKDDFPIDLEMGVRNFLRNTIFAHPEDIKQDEMMKKSTTKKKEKK